MQTDAAPNISKQNDPFLSPECEINQHEKITIVQDKNVERFVERQELLLSPFEYQRMGEDPGLVLIFNQELFEDQPYRLGSRKDVNEIITTMSRLGFNIHDENIFNNLTRDQILDTVTKLVAKDLSQVNSLIVFFLTHGDSFNLLHATDFTLKTHELWEKFVKCEHLKNKPKMFIFQACKGDYHSTTWDQNKEKIDLVPQSTFESNYLGPDMLIVYSTTEGNVSFRDPKNGTWFIQELCKNFSAYGRRDDVISLIMRTTKCLCRNYYHNEEEIIKKQMPIFVSTLKKKFYLNRSKDRNAWFQLLKNQESMMRSIEELKEKINELLKTK
ncbi:caspase-6-like [Tribolium madens]|uniref:caspase-6-like n=1 Tax=Tribolium madens TaxID=41895 RepID=UPI001CF73CF3|nr:caspase-6-like [Tribolium madens]XP_044269705.1 caspase-6-like [Tribolium madens]